MKKIVNSISEAGTLMVEALAMLGLISMVTPVLYKKAAERTVELQDINASGQMRAVSSALDSFLKDNYTTITSGGSVTVSGGEEIDFTGYKNATNHVESFSGENFVKALSPYLPYGFADDGGNIRETKLFNDYDFAIAMNGVDAGENKVNRTLTGFMVANPKNNTTEVTPMRAARIASMIGSNGGYVDDSDTARGTQGIWSVKMSDDLDINDAPENAIVVSSLQPVSAQSLDEELLHRVDKKTDEYDRLNTMETDLFMGTDSETGIKGHNIRMVNQIIMYPRENLMVNEEGQAMGADNLPLGEAHGDAPDAPGGYEQNLKNALYIGNGGGANIEGVLNAMKEHFSVTGDGIRFYNDHQEVDETTGETNTVINHTPTFAATERQFIYGNPDNNVFLFIDRSGESEFWQKTNEVKTGFIKTTMNMIGIGAGGASDGYHNNDYGLKIMKSSYFDHVPAYGTSTEAQRVWTVVAGGGVPFKSGSVDIYTWSNDVPGNPSHKNSLGIGGKIPYELTVNGSAFVRDTLLTAKLKTFDADFSTLRAGAAKEDLANAADGDFFMKVKSIKNGTGTEATYNRTFEIGKSDDLNGGYFKVSSLADNGNGNGIVMRTPSHKAGINVIAGNPWVYDDETPDLLRPDQEDIKIAGEAGVYITSGRADDGLYGMVNIQDMYSAYRSESGGDIWSITDINSDEYNVRPSYDHDNQDDRIGNYTIQDMVMSVSASFENASPTYSEYDVFKVNPWMSDDNFLLGEATMPYSANDADDRPRAIEMTGSVAVYDFDRYAYTSQQFPSFTVDKGQVAIRATQDVPSRQIEKGDRILVVDNDSSGGAGSAISDGSGSHPDQRGSVYIRKGSINLDPAQPVGKTVTRLKESDLGYNTGVTPQGYIAADRFIAHYNDEGSRVGNLLNATGDYNGDPSTSYEGYEVNPAYTSVMHDIKLTTRGGARLSDILPDFINKGIYVVNSTYKEGTKWTSSGFDPINTATGDTMDAEKGENVSAFLGFVPTPKCPPSYAKVVTLMPASWAMAQAGRVVEISGAYDVGVNNRPDQIVSAEDKSVYALDFQKSTWLKSMVIKYGTGDDFKGWSAIMGFIYPKSLWDAGGEDDGSVYWNLFPVKYKELEGYATVYCYFDRKNSAFNSDLVDHNYDQLGAGDDVNYHTKDSNDYIKRLNDPALKYESPW